MDDVVEEEAPMLQEQSNLKIQIKAGHAIL
jgi:hypothetical protein